MRPLPEDDFYPFAPAFVNSHELPLNFGRKIAQQRIGRRMNMQGRSHQIQQRLFVRQLAAFEISETREFAAPMVPLDARPVVQPLEWEMNILVSFQFHNSQPPCLRGREHVDPRPVCGGKRWNLRIPARRLQSPIDQTHVAHHQRLQPTLGAHPPQRVLARSVWMAGIPQTMRQLHELIFISYFENALLRTYAKYDLLGAEK